MGIDGRIFPGFGNAKAPRRDNRRFRLHGRVVSDSGQTERQVGRPDVDSFEAVMMREDRKKGFFVAFDYSSDALTEIGAFFRKTGKVVIALTVKEILEEEIAKKLA